jgi:TRAP transporter TAXI family solute receptor
MKKVAIIFVIAILINFITVYAQATDVYIGTGGSWGVYYPTGNNICSIINSAYDEYGIDCSAVTSSGSVYNINQVVGNFWEFGIVQSDRQYEAWNGLGPWVGYPKENLRSVFSIHYESVILIAAEDSGINTINDLIGKTVNVGPETSNAYQHAINALSYAEITLSDIIPTNYNLSDAANEFQSGSIDALFITYWNPNTIILDLSQGERKIYLVPINNEKDFFEIYPYYAPSIIPIKYYKDAVNNKDVSTFGLKATFITSIEVPNDMVYAFTKEIFDNFLYFRTLHPAYEVLTKNKMLQGLTAPIHPGAMKYFKEVIFLNEKSDKKK